MPGRGRLQPGHALVGELGQRAPAVVGKGSRRIHPVSSIRATAWLSRLREDSEVDASSLIRSVRSGASESRTRIS